MLPDQVGRAYGELGFHAQRGTTITALDAGLGLMPTDHMELSLILPYTTVSVEDSSAAALGNVTVGASYVEVNGTVRLTAGARVALPTAPDSGENAYANLSGTLPGAYQHMTLRTPAAYGFGFPIHLELGGAFMGILDASFDVYKWRSEFADDEELEVSTTVAPGIGGWVSHAAALGVRLPVVAFLTTQDDSDDSAQMSLEPFLRFNLGRHGWLGFRVTIPMDEPLRERDIWGLHVGGGGAF